MTTTPAIPNCLIALACLWLSACASIPTSRPIAPTVEIQSIDIVKIGFRNQDLEIKLKVNNPNSYDLPLQALAFIAAVEGAQIAQGTSNEKVTLPAEGEAIMNVQVSTRLSKLLGRLLSSANSDVADIAYDITGFVKLANWPTRIPFDKAGRVENPARQ